MLGTILIFYYYKNTHVEIYNKMENFHLQLYSQLKFLKQSINNYFSKIIFCKFNLDFVILFSIVV